MPAVAILRIEISVIADVIVFYRKEIQRRPVLLEALSHGLRAIIESAFPVPSANDGLWWNAGKERRDQSIGPFSRQKTAKRENSVIEMRRQNNIHRRINLWSLGYRCQKLNSC